MKKIGIIGPNTSICSQALYDFGLELGQRIATTERAIICGGCGGFMQAVCQGAKRSANTYDGQTIGILPSDDPATANPFIDIAILTGIGSARNMIIVNTADIIIAAGGGAGTLSELAFAWQRRKKVLCLTAFEGWAKQLAGENLDARAEGLLLAVSDIDAIEHYLANV